jgi:hypothetical protein
MSFFTSFCAFPQKEHVRLAPSRFSIGGISATSLAYFLSVRSSGFFFAVIRTSSMIPYSFA